jgi:hypothetical protein
MSGLTTGRSFLDKIHVHEFSASTFKSQRQLQALQEQVEQEVIRDRLSVIA